MKVTVLLLALFQLAACRSSNSSMTMNEHAEGQGGSDLWSYVGCYSAKWEGTISAGAEVANDAKQICLKQSGDSQMTIIFKKDDVPGASEGGMLQLNNIVECGNDCWTLKDDLHTVRLAKEDGVVRLAVSAQGGQVRYSLSKVDSPAASADAFQCKCQNIGDNAGCYIGGKTDAHELTLDTETATLKLADKARNDVYVVKFGHEPNYHPTSPANKNFLKYIPEVNQVSLPPWAGEGGWDVILVEKTLLPGGSNSGQIKIQGPHKYAFKCSKGA
ncbi:MAG: hypothetical protein AB7T49_17055 [Oligoflexales bacterium]